MENKNNYSKPRLEVTPIASDDIITTSVGNKPFVGEDDEFDLNGLNGEAL